MSSIDGEWDVVVKSPLGEQKSVATLQTEGGRLIGQNVTSAETQPLIDGTIEDDTLTWSMNATNPFPMKLEFVAKVTGDRIEGTVKAGIFGKMPLEATRRPKL